jgi:hypothetical protein
LSAALAYLDASDIKEIGVAEGKLLSKQRLIGRGGNLDAHPYYLAGEITISKELLDEIPFFNRIV